MLAPPGIGFGDPESVEARIFAGLGHGDGFVHRLHAELQNSDVEWDDMKSLCSWLLAAS